MEDPDLEKVRAYLAQRSATSRHPSRFKYIERVLLGMGCVVAAKVGVTISIWDKGP